MSRIKVWSSGSNPTNASSSFRLSTSTRSTKRQAWRHTVRGDYTGQNVFKVPNRLCFTRPNSFADCHSTDLPLTQRKWPLSTTLKWPGGGGGGGGGWVAWEYWKYNRQLLTQCLSGYGREENVSLTPFAVLDWTQLILTVSSISLTFFAARHTSWQKLNIKY